MAKFKTSADARALLEKIQTFWAERGYEVRGYVEEGEYSERLRSKSYEVVTDLKNGMPVRKFTKVA